MPTNFRTGAWTPNHVLTAYVDDEAIGPILTEHARVAKASGAAAADLQALRDEYAAAMVSEREAKAAALVAGKVPAKAKAPALLDKIADAEALVEAWHAAEATAYADVDAAVVSRAPALLDQAKAKRPEAGAAVEAAVAALVKAVGALQAIDAEVDDLSQFQSIGLDVWSSPRPLQGSYPRNGSTNAVRVGAPSLPVLNDDGWGPVLDLDSVGALLVGLAADVEDVEDVEPVAVVEAPAPAPVRRRRAVTFVS